MGHVAQENIIASLKKQLELLETEYKHVQDNGDIQKFCALRHRMKQVQEKIRNCKRNGDSYGNYAH